MKNLASEFLSPGFGIFLNFGIFIPGNQDFFGIFYLRDSSRIFYPDYDCKNPRNQPIFHHYLGHIITYIIIYKVTLFNIYNPDNVEVNKAGRRFRRRFEDIV